MTINLSLSTMPSPGLYTFLPIYSKPQTCSVSPDALTTPRTHICHPPVIPPVPPTLKTYARTILQQPRSQARRGLSYEHQKRLLRHYLRTRTTPSRPTSADTATNRGWQSCHRGKVFKLRFIRLLHFTEHAKLLPILPRLIALPF